MCKLMFLGYLYKPNRIQVKELLFVRLETFKATGLFFLFNPIAKDKRKQYDNFNILFSSVKYQKYQPVLGLQNKVNKKTNHSSSL